MCVCVCVCGYELGVFCRDVKGKMSAELMKDFKTQTRLFIWVELMKWIITSATHTHIHTPINAHLHLHATADFILFYYSFVTLSPFNLLCCALWIVGWVSFAKVTLQQWCSIKAFCGPCRIFFFFLNRFNVCHNLSEFNCFELNLKQMSQSCFLVWLSLDFHHIWMAVLAVSACLRQKFCVTDSSQSTTALQWWHNMIVE